MDIGSRSHEYSRWTYTQSSSAYKALDNAWYELRSEILDFIDIARHVGVLSPWRTFPFQTSRRGTPGAEEFLWMRTSPQIEESHRKRWILFHNSYIRSISYSSLGHISSKLMGPWRVSKCVDLSTRIAFIYPVRCRFFSFPPIIDLEFWISFIGL